MKFIHHSMNLLCNTPTICSVLSWRPLQSLGRQHCTWWCPRDITTSKQEKKNYGLVKEGWRKEASPTSKMKRNLYPLPSKWVKYKRKYRALNQSLFSEHNPRQEGCTMTSLPGKAGGHLPQSCIQGKWNFQVLYHCWVFFVWLGFFFHSSVLRILYFCLSICKQGFVLDFTLAYLVFWVTSDCCSGTSTTWWCSCGSDRP